MSFVSRLFKRKKGGTVIGNFIRRAVNNATMGVSDAIGLTDGHLVDGDEANGESNY